MTIIMIQSNYKTPSWLLSCLFLLLLMENKTIAQTPSPSPSAIRINAGGGSFTDNQGNVWSADAFYQNGSVHSSSHDIQGTLTRNEVLYQTERFTPDESSLQYQVPLPNPAIYLVRLHFAEQEGQQVFDIYIQQQLVVEKFDIFQQAGGLYLPYIVNHVVAVDNNNTTLTIDLIKQQKSPKISGIEVLPMDYSLYINAGSDVSVTDSQGTTWQPDEYYNGGETYATKVDIRNTDNDVIYQTERYQRGTLQYDIPVPSSGMYQVTLHFSDNYKPMHEIGKRVFRVEMEGSTILEHLDLYQEGQKQGFTAITKTLLVPVQGDVLTIALVPEKQNPTIAGLEIHGFGVMGASSTNEASDKDSAISPQPVSSLPQNTNDIFAPLYINAGSSEAINDGVDGWEQDMYYNGGGPGSTRRSISGTPFGKIYQTYRYGTAFEYEIDVPNGAYQVTLHFAETQEANQYDGARIFHVFIEESLVLEQLDIYKSAGGYASYVVEVPTMVSDGALSVEFAAKTGEAILAALEVTAMTESQQAMGEAQPHYAHSVPGGPYFAVDTDNDGKATIAVDGYFSHTHLPGAWLTRWTWTVNGNVVGDDAEATLIDLPVGEHTLVLEVEDSGGYNASDYTTVTVRNYGYPDISWIWPESGDVAGGKLLKIGGSGFLSSAADTTVFIGSEALSGNDINIVNDETIEVQKMPKHSSPGMVDVMVQTPQGTSTPVSYTYVDNTLPPIHFNSGIIDEIEGPTCLTFDNTGRNLYIGTQQGLIVRLTLDDDYQVVDKLVSNVVAASEDVERAILGIAIDPTDISEYPKVYVSHSWLFHRQIKSFNGKVSAVSSPNLNQLTHVVTGLPVSDHDHGVNGIVFGDEGELYIQTPGNTNAGVPGSLSITKQQEEDFFSCATIVASNINSPTFDGHIEYDDEGNQISGWDVAIFAFGQRNSYGITLHSNGYLYATDNGANRGYGTISTSCTEGVPGPDEPDKLNVVMRGNYYGHANRKRGEIDKRQCKWRSAHDEGDDDYTAPIAILPPSSNGLCEFETEHFAGQLRGNLIIARWKGELYNVALSPDGLATEKDTFDIPPILIEEGALDIVQGPDGTLFTARHSENAVYFYSPAEDVTPGLKVKGVFPRRGPQEGGSTLSVYGDNLYTFGFPSVTVGGNACIVHSPTSDAKITCTLPSGDGIANVIVTAGLQSNVFKGGYRYIKATPGGRSDIHAAPVHTPLPQQSDSPLQSRIDDSVETVDSLVVWALVWVDTEANKDIGPVIDCDACFDPSSHVTIRADTWGDVNSVRMTLDGPIKFSAIENSPPHALFGAKRWDYQGMVFEKGKYTVTAQAFSEPDGQGLASKIMSVDFEIK